MTDELVELVARALYAHWTNVEDGLNEYCTWEKLGDKQTWLDRANAVLTALAPHIRAREIAAGERVRDAHIAYLGAGGDTFEGQWHAWDSEMRSYASGFGEILASLDTAAIVETKL